MNSNFIILNKEKYLLSYLDTYVLSSIPKNNIIYKIKINDEILKLIENTIRFNINKGNIRNKHLNESKVNVYLLEFYLGVIYDKKIIINKRFLSSIRVLKEIKNMLNGLEKYYESCKE